MRPIIVYDVSVKACKKSSVLKVVRTRVRLPYGPQNLKFKLMREFTYQGKEDRATAEKLKAGETCYVVGIGNSMTPVLKSHQPVIVEPVTAETELKKKDIVLAKARGHYYLHFIHGIKGNGEEFLIGNNHGHMNGWVSRSCVFGKVVEILP